MTKRIKRLLAEQTLMFECICALGAVSFIAVALFGVIVPIVELHR